jgi:S-adenosylmethionine hydrolase
VAPDNGLLAGICELPGADTRRLDGSDTERLGLGEISDTFHGRDILAPIGADIASGKVRPADLGPKTDSVVPSWIEDPVVSAGKIKGTVVALDNFGNLITNITAEHLAGLKDPFVLAGGHRFRFRRTYGLASPGDYVALVNSFGMVELARAEQSAASALGIGRGAPVVVEQG